jgi:hypothetical protein
VHAADLQALDGGFGDASALGEDTLASDEQCGSASLDDLAEAKCFGIVEQVGHGSAPPSSPGHITLTTS